MKPHVAFLLLIVSISACTRMENPNFLPRDSDLQAGIYNKYYVHYQPTDRNEWNTEFQYIRLKKQGNFILSQNIKPDYQVTTDNFIDPSEPNWILNKTLSYFGNGDTISTNYIQPYIYNFNNEDIPPSEVETIYSNDSYFYEYLEHQNTRDSIIVNRPAKILTAKGYRIFRTNSDTTELNISRTTIYVDGIGLYYSRLSTPAFNYIWELVEQIPERAYRKLLSEKPERIAYINPNETLDRGTNFSSCDSSDQIVDYYNGNPDGAPVGRKRTLEKLTADMWDFAERSGVSGYLTLRFVLNCEGEVGWFVTEQADLDFGATTFPPDIIQRAKDIIESVPEWQPTKIYGESRDSYAYITFKLQDAQVIDILP
ncbi:MAG: hypothetical protein AAGF87_17630 [Bacteroidota bacterium]